MVGRAWLILILLVPLASPMAAQTDYKAWLQGVFERDILGRMPPRMRSALGTVSLETPAGGPGQFVLTVGTIPEQRAVVFPLSTARWLDEYSALTALVARDACDTRRMLPLVYVGKIAVAGAGVAVPTPFEAFGLDATVYNDAFVRTVSSKQLSSAVGFLLAHELGHLAHQHRAGLMGAESQQQEREADAYALKVMRAIRLNPLGMPMLFVAAALLENGQTTHPMSGSRVVAATAALEAHPAEFVDREQKDPAVAMAKIRTIAQEIRVAIPLVDDPARRRSVIDFGRRFDFVAFRGVLNAPCPR